MIYITTSAVSSTFDLCYQAQWLVCCLCDSSSRWHLQKGILALHHITLTEERHSAESMDPRILGGVMSKLGDYGCWKQYLTPTGKHSYNCTTQSASQAGNGCCNKVLWHLSMYPCIFQNASSVPALVHMKWRSLAHRIQQGLESQMHDPHGAPTEPRACPGLPSQSTAL